MRRRQPDPLDTPNYGYQEAVRYLHVPHATLYYWLGVDLGLVRPADRGLRLLSFKNLVECYVIKGLKEIHGVRLPHIRRAVRYMAKTFRSRHPLADYELQTDGRHVYFWHHGQLLDVSLEGQIGMKDVLDAYLRRIERDWTQNHWAFYPFMRLEQMRSAADHPKVVVMNPNVCSGKPVLVGTRITTAILASRHLGGDSAETLAQSYGRPVGEIEEAVAWEIGRAPKAA